MRDVALSLINRLNQTESAVFTLDAVIPKDLFFSDYLHIFESLLIFRLP